MPKPKPNLTLALTAKSNPPNASQGLNEATNAGLNIASQQGIGLR